MSPLFSEKFVRTVGLFAFCVGLLAFYGLNVQMPILSDDYRYCFIWPTAERVRSLYDIVLSQKAHYMTWGGRVFSHGALQAVLLCDKCLFNVLNALMYLGVALGVCRMAGAQLSRCLPVAAALLFTEPGMRFIWQPAACGYLWSSAVLVAYLVLFLSDSPRSRWLSLLLAFVSGHSQETLGIALCVSLGLYLPLSPERRRNRVLWSSLLLAGLGAASSVLAPGNYVRMGSGIAWSVDSLQGIFCAFVYDAFRLARAMQGEMFLPIVLLVSAVGLQLGYRIYRRAWHTLGLCFLVGAFAAGSIPFASHTMYAAAFHGCSFFACLSISVILLPYVSACRARTYMMILVLSACSLGRTDVRAYRGIRGINALASYMEQQGKNGCRHILIPPALAAYKSFNYHNNYLRNLHEALVRKVPVYTAFVDPTEQALFLDKAAWASLEAGELRPYADDYLIWRLPKEPCAVTLTEHAVPKPLSLTDPKSYVRDYPYTQQRRMDPGLFAENGAYYLFFRMQSESVTAELRFADGCRGCYQIERTPSHGVVLRAS